MKYDSKIGRTCSTLDGLSDTRFVQCCYAASTISAYLGAVFISFPAVDLDLGDAATLQSIILMLPLHLIMPQTVLFLPYVFVCVFVSMLWVHPISRWEKATRGMRLTGVCIVGALASMGLFLYLSLNVPMGRQRPHADIARCQNNLKQIGVSFNWFANENANEAYPELSRHPGTLAPRSDAAYPGLVPEYRIDLSVFQCPKVQRPHWWVKPPPPTTTEDDESYFYLGYEIPDQATLVQFAAAYREQIVRGGDFSGDLLLEREGESPIVIQRLSERSGVPAGGFPSIQAAVEAQARVPILIERHPNGHSVDCGNVLYKDGHVERIAWGAKWPMTKDAMDALLALDALAAP